MRNQDLRDLTRAKRLFSYEVAEAMGLSRSAYFDLLRKKDLPEKVLLFRVSCIDLV